MTYDGIILGTGHNALVLQAYLARCGLRVLSVDRADVPGGGLATIENPRLPGGTMPERDAAAIETSPRQRWAFLERSGIEDPQLRAGLGVQRDDPVK